MLYHIVFFFIFVSAFLNQNFVETKLLKCLVFQTINRFKIHARNFFTAVGPPYLDIVGRHSPREAFRGSSSTSTACIRSVGGRWCTARSGKFYRARSRLYRSRNLHLKPHLKALAEIHTTHTFLSISDLRCA